MKGNNEGTKSMSKLQFKAYDHVNRKWFFSKDYTSLNEFFSYFDNVQHSIEMVSDGNEIIQLLQAEKTLNAITTFAIECDSANRCIQPNEILNLK